ncbi:retrovirus-related pol polyprotein from transposon TNT 1-94 [Tanacetum coccineum]|uniref:Retrovirus-related pol polyprotein from transposon TNT 1-94 n=1 Tax=Tanacetum coccineum TaxID=301880 RepID=A0ABQ5GQA6_9ASTR
MNSDSNGHSLPLITESLILQLNSKSVENADLKAQIQDKVFVVTLLKDDLQKLKGKEIVENAAQIPFATTIAPRMFKLDIEPISHRLKNNRDAHEDYLKKIIGNTNTIHGLVERARKQNPSQPLLVSACMFTKHVVQIVLWYLDSGCSKHMTGNCSQLMNFVSKFLGTVRFENDQIAKIIGSRDTNLYTISLYDMLKTSPICLLLRASKTKGWLWHRRLSHVNFGTLNKLAKDGLARGIPKLKFMKDHLHSACALGKSKKSSYQPKAKDTNQEKLYLLHMDLCGPMRVESINGKKYILVIVDDYS